MRVASVEGLIASNLQRVSYRDLSDVEAIVYAHGVIPLDGWTLTRQQLVDYRQAIANARHDGHRRTQPRG